MLLTAEGILSMLSRVLHFFGRLTLYVLHVSCHRVDLNDRSEQYVSRAVI